MQSVNRVMKKLPPPPPHPTPIPPRTLVRLLDGEQERQEQRAEEDHAEGSANDMDVEWEMRYQQASQTFEARVDVGLLAVGGSTIFAWERCCTRSLARSLHHVQRTECALENCLVCRWKSATAPHFCCKALVRAFQSWGVSMPKNGLLSEQPPTDGMQIYSFFITQIHKSFPNGGSYPDEVLLKVAETSFWSRHLIWF